MDTYTTKTKDMAKNTIIYYHKQCTITLNPQNNDFCLGILMKFNNKEKFHQLCFQISSFVIQEEMLWWF